MISNALKRLEDGVLAVLLIGMIAVAAYQVGARNFFDGGLLWGDALVRVLVLWITMVGAMVGVRRSEHIRVDLLPRLFGALGREVASRISSFFAAVVCGLFSWHSFQFVRYEYEDGIIAFAKVPAWICEAIIPFGFAVMTLRYVHRVLVKP